MACNNYTKSTLVATSYKQTLAINDIVPFTNTQRITGTAITITPNDTVINLNRAGLYRVTVSATGTGTVDATPVTLQINRNGVALPDGIASFTPATATGNAESMSVSTIVEVNTTTGQGYSSIPITVTNTGSASDYEFIIITVEKIA